MASSRCRSLGSDRFGREPSVASRRGIALGRPRANVKIEPSDDGKGFFATVPAGVQDVEALALPSVPRNATGVAFRMYSSAPRRDLGSALRARCSRNFYQTNVDFSGKVQDVAVNFDRFGRIGRPDAGRLRNLRLASKNTQLRDSANVLSAPFTGFSNRQRFDSPFAIWRSLRTVGINIITVAIAIASCSKRLPGWLRLRQGTKIAQGGLYDVVARVQENKRALSLQVSVDGRAARCSADRLRSDVSERLVRLARLPVSAGRAHISVRYCSAPMPSPKTQDVGVAALILASARLAPPARRTTGTSASWQSAPERSA